MNLPIPNVYDPENAARLCAASAQAYSGRNAQERTAAVIENRATDTLVLLLDEGTELIVAFRGTQDLRNWLSDADCALVPSVYGRAHAGFTAALNSIYAELAETIFDANAAGKRVWLTGHSLGGALAMLCARLLIKPLAGCYTFGQPRVGDAEFCNAYDALLKDRTHRVVHDADIVPRVPWLLGTYRHAGHEIFYPHAQRESETSNLKFQIPQWKVDPSFWSKLPSDARSMANGFLHGKVSMLDDHHIRTYETLFVAHPITNNKFSITNSQLPEKAIENWQLQIGHLSLNSPQNPSTR